MGNVNIERIKGQTMIYKTYYRKLNIEQHKPHQKPEVWGTP